jgi:FHS family L-fucose permease-like MFS transporter
MKLKALPVFLAFLAMGFGDAVGPFVGLAKNQFHLTTAVATLIPFVGLCMFGLISVPAGVLQNRLGRKSVLLLGLLVALAGVLNASFGLTSFVRFLLTVLLIGAGAAILQVAGNPLMRDVSACGKFPRNLALGQFVKAIGSLSGPMIPMIAARYFGMGWNVIFPIYSAALVITILTTSMLNVPRDAPPPQTATMRSCLALLGDRYVLLMTGAIFLYVGAEVSVSAGIPLFLKEQYNLDIARVGLLGTGLFFTALTIGRFSGGLILNWAAPLKFLKLSCALALIGLATLFVPSRNIAVLGLLITGLGFANIFPLVFSSALERMPSRVNEISGLMVTAIVGGAILPPVMGLVAEHSSVRAGFMVPAVAIAYVAATTLVNRSKLAASSVGLPEPARWRS